MAPPKPVVVRPPWPKLIILVRHGQSIGNTLTRAERVKIPMGSNFYNLTDLGREQARLTGAWLRERWPNPRAVFRSYYTRTRETAEFLYPGRPIYEDERVAESNRGIWHVRSEEEIARQAPWEIDRRDFEGKYHYRPLGGENWPDIELRIRDFRRSLRNRYPGRVVVVVTHGFWIMIWQKLAHHWTVDEAIAKFERDDVVPNASVLLYHGTVDEECNKPRLVHDPKTDFFVPWEGNLATP